MLAESGCWMQNLGIWLKEKWGNKYPKCCDKEIAKWMFNIAAWFMADAKAVKPWWGADLTFDNQSVKDILKIDFIDMKTSVCEMSETLIATGYVPPPQKPKQSGGGLCMSKADIDGPAKINKDKA